MYLVPKLYGKIEPLLGVAPRDENTVVGDGEKMGIKTFVLCAIAFVVAIGGEFMAENGLAIIDWEAAWAGNSTAMIVSGVTVSYTHLDVYKRQVMRWQQNIINLLL